jgi:hypothetical protein
MKIAPNHRPTNDPIARNSFETMFADAVQALGGVAYTLGPIPKSGTFLQTPNDFEKRPITAPDIAFSLPSQPFLIAQINAMRLETTLENPEPHFVLHQEQYRRMMEASQSFHTLCVIYCETLNLVQGLAPLSYVSRPDLHAEQITALKQTEQTKPRYSLPLHILKPLSELTSEGSSQDLPLKDNRTRTRQTSRHHQKKPVQSSRNSETQTKG